MLHSEPRERLRCPTFPMTSTPSEPPSAPRSEPGKKAPDRELAELPAPRRPWRRATLVPLGVGALLSTALAFAVLPDVAYAFRTGDPRDLGDLTHARLDSA